MRSTDEMQLEKMLDCLSLVGLTTEQVEKAERYFTKEVEKLELEVKEKRNAAEVDRESREQVGKQFDKLMNIRYEEYAKLFQVLFEIFGTSTKEFFKIYQLGYVIRNKEQLKYMPKVSFLAVYAEMTSSEQRFWEAEIFKEILAIAENDNTVLEHAIEVVDTKTVNARLMIYTAYFMLNQDREKFDKYISLITGNVRKLFNTTITDDEIRELEDFINESETAQRNKQVCDILKKYSMNEFPLILFVTCAAVHYKASSKLCNLLKLCAYGKNFNKTLDLISKATEAIDIESLAVELKKDLQLESVDYILWCAKKGLRGILKQEALDNSQSYIGAIEEVEASNYMFLVAVVKGLEASVYDKYYKSVLEDEIEKRRQKIIDEFISEHGNSSSSGHLITKIRAFLMGECKVDELYANQAELSSRYYYTQLKFMLNNYRFVYGKDMFYKRCKTLVALENKYYVLLDGFSPRGVDEKKFIADLFHEFKESGLSIAKQYEVAVGIYKNAYHKLEELAEAYISLFTNYMKESEAEVLEAFKNAEAEGRMIAIRALERAGDKYKEPLFEYFSDSAKLVKNELIELISKHEEWADKVLDKLNSKKAAEREQAVTIISKFKGDYSAKLLEALEKEKSKKIVDLLKALLNVETNEEEKVEISAESYVKELHKGNRKRGLAWAYETAFVPVHFADSTELASEEYMQAVLLSYSGMNLPGYNKEVFLLTDKLNKEELALYVNELFDKWLELGAQAKQKWVLYASAIHGGANVTEKMKRQIDEWAKNSRGSIAADAVKALALNDSPTALLLVDGIARKYKFKQVKAAAGAALENAAKELGLSTEELADKIVPDLGFNENMERIFDYGERTFKVYITPTLEIEVYDQNDKKLKNIPAPGKKDDESKAAAAYAEFKQMKKQMKTTIANQKQRLELALSIERKWNANKWQELFVKNPIMHQFAISLIWGCYENGVLKETFRYMEDGSFNTVDEDEYELPKDAVIGLVHPIELEEDIKKQWEEQLEDYEITQSIEQLKRPIYRITDEEKDAKLLERFGGMVLNGLSLSGKMLSMGWYRGTPLDAGFYVVYIREDKECDMGVALHFSGLPVGYENEGATVYGAHFYKPGSAKTVGFSYEYIKEEEACKLGDVPPRYFSEVVYQLTKATASSEEKDERWREAFKRK